LATAEGRLFSDWLDDMLRREERKLHTKNEYTDVFRAQGSTSILNDILNLEEDLKQYGQDVSEGKIQPIKEA
jgi:hypothetical protein